MKEGERIMDPLKNISKLKLTGAVFDTATSFDFFNPYEGTKIKTNKGAILYGRNGAGNLYGKILQCSTLCAVKGSYTSIWSVSGNEN